VKTGYGSFDGVELEAIEGRTIAVITSTFNSEITGKLKQGALSTLKKWNVPEDKIIQVDVPGAYELPLAAGLALKAGADAVIALGCVIRGETTHYDYVCQSAERGLSRLQLKHLKPVVFGVLTTENSEQAWARANKGEESAWVALRMLTVRHQLTLMKED
jgi:6,7-dimethyl-8-ribityllumazine synthase